VTSAPAPPPSVSAELADDLRADLRGVGYTTERVGEVLGPLADAALHREQPLPAVLATAGSTEPVAVLVRVFVLGLAVPVESLASALPRTGAEGAVALGLVRAEDDGVRGLCDLRPYGQDDHTWWVASDLTELATGSALSTDHVLGVGGASTTLASWTPRPRVRRALDLGTGCGVQSLHLAGHTSHRVATDLSQRALGFARFNAALNDVELDLRQGSLWDPVAGEEFDLVVSNPPFVITPRRAEVPVYDYRDGGAAGDALVAGLVRDLPRHLAPGGIAQLLGNWELTAGEDWRDHLTSWLDGTGLDAWVVQREEQDVAQYAETWARDGGHRPGTPAFDRLYAAWLADFAERGVERVGLGIVTVQRPAQDRPTWRVLEQVTTPTAGPMGPTVLAGIRARTWLALHTDAEVLSVPWSVADDVTEERVGRPGAPDPAVIQLRQGGGLRRVVGLDSLTAGVVGACDGDLTGSQLVQAVAVLTGTEASVATAQVVPRLRELIAAGLLH
jgi:methylase of polypeptide subunit release factors